MNELKKLLPPSLAIGVLLALFVSPSSSTQAMEPSSMEALVDGNTAFALDLYGKLKDTEGNLFFSPYSISAALAMTYAGARGSTEKQMAKVLHFTMRQKDLHAVFSELQRRLNEKGERGEYQLSVANAIWGQKGYSFLDGFLSVLDERYGAGLHEVDFIGAPDAACQRINTWVEEQTKGKIKDLISPDVLDELVRLVLTNAIYFKGQWAAQFREGGTRDAPFMLLDGQELNVPMMSQKGTFQYNETDDLQILEMPYEGHEISMVVLLPKRFDGLRDLENSLSRDALEGWLAERREEKEVTVYLPKFTSTSQFTLADVLQSMGMEDAFDINRADFSGMTGERKLFISAVVHKAFIDVNEEGTEAAAATGVIMKAYISEKPTIFRADHPFLFVIRENESGSILFIGRLVHPGE